MNSDYTVFNEIDQFSHLRAGIEQSFRGVHTMTCTYTAAILFDEPEPGQPFNGGLGSCNGNSIFPVVHLGVIPGLYIHHGCRCVVNVIKIAVYPDMILQEVSFS